MVQLQSQIQEQARRETPVAEHNFLIWAGRLLPARISAWFIERFLQPPSTASLAAQMPPRKAAAIVEHLSTDYLVNATRCIEPDQLQALLLLISPETTGRIAKYLADDRAFAEMSGLVAYLSPRSITSVVRVLYSGDDLLKIATQVEDKYLLAPAIAHLPTKRLPGLFSAAETDDNWQVIFDIVEALDASTKRQLGERLADLAHTDMTDLLWASLRLNTWSQLLVIWQSLSGHARERLAANIANQEEGLHLKFIEVAEQQGRMQSLLKLISDMPLADQRRLVRLAGRKGIRITSVL